MDAQRKPFLWTGLALVCALFAVAAVATPAQAGCEICDQYTLDIPEPKNDGNQGSGGGSSDGSADGSGTEAPAPAPVPVTPTTDPEPVTPATEPAPAEEPKAEKKKRRKPKPAPDLVRARADAPRVEPALPASTPLEYDSSDSATEAALAGLGSPGTVALIVILIGAGVAVAVGRRRSSP